ncbi:hypothetical protein MKY92_24290 [Paenibacillus sp. FSL R5-0623]
MPRRSEALAFDTPFYSIQIHSVKWGSNSDQRGIPLTKRLRAPNQ